MQTHFTLRDNHGNEEYIAVEARNGSLFITPEGHGDACSVDGAGSPVALDFNCGVLTLLVWADINKADPTHIINLEDAKETNRNTD